MKSVKGNSTSKSKESSIGTFPHLSPPRGGILRPPALRVEPHFQRQGMDTRSVVGQFRQVKILNILLIVGDYSSAVCTRTGSFCFSTILGPSYRKLQVYLVSVALMDYFLNSFVNLDPAFRILRRCTYFADQIGPAYRRELVMPVPTIQAQI